MIVLFVIYVYLIGIKNMTTHFIDGDGLCDIINDIIALVSHANCMIRN